MEGGCQGPARTMFDVLLSHCHTPNVSSICLQEVPWLPIRFPRSWLRLGHLSCLPEVESEVRSGGCVYKSVARPVLANANPRAVTNHKPHATQLSRTSKLIFATLRPIFPFFRRIDIGGATSDIKHSRSPILSYSLCTIALGQADQPTVPWGKMVARAGWSGQHGEP